MFSNWPCSAERGSEQGVDRVRDEREREREREREWRERENGERERMEMGGECTGLESAVGLKLGACWK